jgi:PAS domain S-box-containing protein
MSDISAMSVQTTNLIVSSASADEPGWPQRVIGEIQDLLLLLTPDGKVLYVSPSCETITGYTPSELENEYLLRYVHNDDKSIFSSEMEECVATGRPLQCHFRFAKPDKSCRLLEAYGHPHVVSEKLRQTCNGIFLVCRPYPTKSCQLLDSFLEHKIENIRLHQRIAQLKEEEEEDLNGIQQISAQASGAVRRPPPPVAQDTYSGEENESSDSLTLDESDARAQAVEELATEDMSHIEGIEVMTGLFYGEGERSQGLSTGLRQGRLIQCGMETITPDQQARTIQDSDRRKRLKGEYMCTDCGTSDSPEWRKGPDGPKTLCNACGCKWPSPCTNPSMWKLTAIPICSTVGQKRKETPRITTGLGRMHITVLLEYSCFCVAKNSSCDDTHAFNHFVTIYQCPPFVPAVGNRLV